MSIDPYRLPTSVRPTDYRITIEPDLETETFSGAVDIEAEVAEATGTITLNSSKLVIADATVSVAGAEPVPCEVRDEPDHERLHLTPPQPLEPGPITVSIRFDGVFNDQLVGLYISRFTDDDGNEHKLATTQFEATHARLCFPCWDEPEFKATFAISLVIDEAHAAFANGPELSRSPVDGGKVAIDFAPTIAMSSYLVAFVVGPLEVTDPVDVDGTPLRIVHIPGKGNLTSFALEAGAFALRYFTDFFGLPYPDRKLDLVAIPDFAFGAMENLGCVTFREVVLLIDPERATQPELQRAADVINHEIAHMWFGDLVTMKWWNGLWLNEAFATFMEMRCTDAFRPDWERWTDFGLSRTAAFDTDSLATTRPIEYEVISPSDAEGMFDILTYEKGAAVVRMLEQYLGEDEFRTGIQRYMAEHQYGNAETTDLWDALEAETGEPVRRIMDSWIFQGGFPLVSIETDGDKVSLRQSRMRYAGGGESADQQWVVPIGYRWKAAGDEEPRTDRLLLDGDEPVTLDLDRSPEWLVANAEGAGFLRSAYPDDLRDALADVATEELSAVERYALVDDTWASVLAGRTSTPAFVNLLEALTADMNRSVWQRMIGGFNHLKRLVDGEAEERLADIAHDAMAPALANLGLAPSPDDDDGQRQLRGDLVRALGTVAGDPEIQEEAARAVAMGRRNPELVDASLFSAAIDVVAAGGDEVDFDDFVTAWEAATTPQEELRFLGALNDFPQAELSKRVHTMILEGQVRSQNAPLLLRRALFNPHIAHQTWEFITTRWDTLTDQFASNLVVRMLEGITALNTPEQQASVEAFFAEHQVSSGARTLEQILEKQRVLVALRQREEERLTRFLVA